MKFIGENNMKALLIQVDGPIPNRALRCWGGYLKERGYEVFYNDGCPDPDLVKVSCIFEWNALRAREIAERFSCPVEMGGYGIDKKAKLPLEVEHHMPDYEGLDFSMGFTTWGCFRRCEFCDTWKIEGGIRERAPIEEFWDPSHRKLILFDNNILGLLSWKRKLEFIRSQGLKLCVTQGYDARVITEESAKLIAEIPHYNWKFGDRAVYTAWDRLEDEEPVLRGIQHLIDAGVKPRHVIPYVLVGFNTNLEQDLYRFNKLREFGVYPFVMPYDNKGHPMKRWGQRPALFKTMPFEKWHQIRIESGRSY